jgi:hypothetical protein
VIEIDRRFGLTHRLDEGWSKHFWNIGHFLPDDTAQHPTGQTSSFLSPWEPEISPTIRSSILHLLAAGSGVWTHGKIRFITIEVLETAAVHNLVLFFPVSLWKHFYLQSQKTEWVLSIHTVRRLNWGYWTRSLYCTLSLSRGSWGVQATFSSYSEVNWEE